MPRNGSGGYDLPPGINPVVTQTIITSQWANTTLQDVAFALAQSISNDGQTLPVANLPMNGFRHYGASDPALRQDYATLGFVQDGRHLRLTNVLGTSVIKANLPGGGLTLSVGQLVQLIPIGNNTIANVTLSINGGSTHTIKSPGGNAVPVNGLQAGKVYLLSFDGVDWNMVNAPGQVAFAQAAMSGWDRPTILGPFPDMSIVNPTTIHIPAGKGRIIRPGATDLAGVTEVSWSAQDIGIVNLATAWATTIGVDATGAVVQFAGNVQGAWARNNIILGVAGHVNGTVTNVITRPTIFGDMVYAAYDLGTLFHNMLIGGGQMKANAGNPLHLDIAAGSVWLLGSNPDAVDSPNIYSFPAQPDIQFFPIRADNIVGVQTGLVPTTAYQPNGVGAPIAIPGAASTATIARLYILANQFLMLYGQRTYADLETALSQIQVDDSALVRPTKLVDATFVGYLVFQKNTAGFNDPATARLVTAGGASFSIGSAGSISDAPLDGSSYGRNNAAWQKVVDQVQPGTNVTVNAANPNKPVVNVPSGNLVAGVGASFSGSAGTDRLLGAGNLTITGTETFRNKVINGNFDIWQRGVSSALASTNRFVADRWSVETLAPSQSAVAQIAFTVGQTDVPNSPRYFHRVNNTSVAGGQCLVATFLEDVTQYGGQTVTVTWWAKADANRQMSLELQQRFGGTGGAEAPVSGLGITKVNLTTSWQKFSATVALPSIAGKALGPGPTMLKVFFWYDSSPASDPRTNNLGQQSGIFDLAQVQIEYGSAASNFEVRPKGLELMLCQRYYETSYNEGVYAGANSQLGRCGITIGGLTGTLQTIPQSFKVSKARINVPGLIIYSTFSGAAGMVGQSDGSDIAGGVTNIGYYGFEVTQTNAVGKNGGRYHFTYDSDLFNI